MLARTFPLGAMVRRWPATSMVPSTSPSMMRGSWLRISPVTVTSLPRTAWDVDIWVETEMAAAMLLLLSGRGSSIRLTPVFCLTLIFFPVQRLVHFHERPFVRADRPGVLPNVADVVNSARQNVKVSIFDGLKGCDLELGVARDLFQTDSASLADRRYSPVMQRQCRHAFSCDLYRRTVSDATGSAGNNRTTSSVFTSHPSRPPPG